MEPYFRKELTERQSEVAAFFMKCLGSDVDHMHYIKSQEYYTDYFPIDLIIYEPTEFFDGYVAITAGLSDYRFDKFFGRSELLMVLPKNWKPVFDKEEYYWPLKILLDVAYGVVENKQGTMIGQVYLPREDEDGYTNYSDAIGAILTLPEEFPIQMYEIEGENSYTRFLQVVPISKDDLSKIEENGPAKFIQYNLHDSEGPQMRVKIPEKPLAGIDKIIKQNEDSLKNKKK